MSVTFHNILSELSDINDMVNTIDKRLYTKYDKDCIHYEIYSKDFKKQLFKKLNLPPHITLDIFMNSEVRYIVYNIKNKYKLDYHDDNCDLTILIGLNKNSNINDNLTFGNIEARNKLWTNGMMIFDGHLLHGGYINGNGSRNLLSIHINIEKEVKYSRIPTE